MAYASRAGRNPAGSSGRARLEERSAGAVIFRRAKDGIMYLLLKYPAGHWDLPKGNIEAGEEPLETAIREVREETGLVDLKFLPGFKRKIEYFYWREGAKVHKTVTFFVAETKVEQVTISFEHQDYRWFGLEEAVERATYPNAKTLIRDAETLAKAQD